ncbi:MAG TPA: hypothetical protein VGM23_11725, partial [Armatimonadota bacterium]
SPFQGWTVLLEQLPRALPWADGLQPFGLLPCPFCAKFYGAVADGCCGYWALAFTKTARRPLPGGAQVRDITSAIRRRR